MTRSAKLEPYCIARTTTAVPHCKSTNLAYQDTSIARTTKTACCSPTMEEMETQIILKRTMNAKRCACNIDVFSDPDPSFTIFVYIEEIINVPAMVLLPPLSFELAQHFSSQYDTMDRRNLSSTSLW
ncbi:unnamed protein product, partial [Strongylus vulgaris]